jgi:hypothetical protein
VYGTFDFVGRSVLKLRMALFGHRIKQGILIFIDLGRLAPCATNRNGGAA